MSLFVHLGEDDAVVSDKEFTIFTVTGRIDSGQFSLNQGARKLRD